MGKMWNWVGGATCIPDFDRLVVGARHDGLAVAGEKATELTQSLCARRFSASSSMDAATNTGAVRFGPRVSVFSAC